MLATFLVTFSILFVILGIPTLVICAIIGAIYKGPIISVEQVGSNGNKVILNVRYKRGKNYIVKVNLGSSDYKEYMRHMNK